MLCVKQIVFVEEHPVFKADLLVTRSADFSCVNGVFYGAKAKCVMSPVRLYDPSKHLGKFIAVSVAQGVHMTAGDGGSVVCRAVIGGRDRLTASFFSIFAGSGSSP